MPIEHTFLAHFCHTLCARGCISSTKPRNAHMSALGWLSFLFRLPFSALFSMELSCVVVSLCRRLFQVQSHRRHVRAHSQSLHCGWDRIECKYISRLPGRLYCSKLLMPMRCRHFHGSILDTRHIAFSGSEWYSKRQRLRFCTTPTVLQAIMRTAQQTSAFSTVKQRARIGGWFSVESWDFLSAYVR